MFLTQFDINVARRDAMRLLASPERIHAAVLGAFPPRPVRLRWRTHPVASGPGPCQARCAAHDCPVSYTHLTLPTNREV